MKRKLLLFYCVLSFSISSLKAQEFKDRIFQSIGVSFLIDVVNSPLRDYTGSIFYNTNTGNYDTYKDAISDASLSYVTFFYTPRYTVYEPNKEFSVSLTMPISVALAGSTLVGNTAGIYTTTSGGASGGLGFMRLGFPIYACANLGMGSTYSSEKEKGFVLGFGIDNMITPMFVFLDYGSLGGFSKYVGMPSMLLGYRYWRGDKAQEIDLKLSYSGNSTVGTQTSNGFAFSLSWHRLIKY